MKRNYGIDFLRIVLMMMVVWCHVLGHGGILNRMPHGSIRYEVAWVLEFMGIFSVNCYVMITGFLGVRTEFSLKRLGKLWLQALFYSVSITLLFFIFKRGEVLKVDLLYSFLPVTKNQYWFFTQYFAMMFFAPFLEAGMERMEFASFEKAFWGMFTLVTILPTFFREDPFVTSLGYSVIWFLFLYMAGAYLRKKDWKRSKLLLIVCFFLIVLIECLVKWIVESNMIALQNDELSAFLMYWVNFTSPFCVLKAMIFILLFRTVKIPEKLEKVVGVVSAVSFSVYLIHDHPLVREYLMNGRFAFICGYSIPLFVVLLFAIAIGIYTICAILDLPRFFLFQMLYKKNKK